MRVHTGNVDLVGVFGVLAKVDDLVRSALVLFIFGDLHGGDAARNENVGLNVGLVGLAGNLLDNATKNAVAEVGVGPVGAGRIGERKIGDALSDELGLIPAIVVHHRVSVVVRPTAGGVGEEMVHSDVRDILLVGRFTVFDAKDAGGTKDLVGEVELASFDERKDGD